MASLSICSPDTKCSEVLDADPLQRPLHNTVRGAIDPNRVGKPTDVSIIFSSSPSLLGEGLGEEGSRREANAPRLSTSAILTNLSDIDRYSPLEGPGSCGTIVPFNDEHVSRTPVFPANPAKRLDASPVIACGYCMPCWWTPGENLNCWFGVDSLSIHENRNTTIGTGLGRGSIHCSPGVFAREGQYGATCADP